MLWLKVTRDINMTKYLEGLSVARGSVTRDEVLTAAVKYIIMQNKSCYNIYAFSLHPMIII